MAFLVGVFEGDFDAFKQQFDSDPLDRKQAAKRHTMLRGVDNPNRDIPAGRIRFCRGGQIVPGQGSRLDVLQNVTVKVPPTVTEMADQATY